MATEQRTETTWAPTSGPDPGTDHRTEPHGLVEVLEDIERDLILTALKESRGNKAKAARALGITERFMGLHVKRLGIDWRGFRPRRKQSAPRIT